MKKILITGGTGFIGSNLANTLYDLGHEVIITGTNTEQKVRCDKMLSHHLTGVDWDALENIDIVFHQAAINDTLNENEDEMFLANVTASRNLFQELFQRGCRRFVYASSTAIYGDSPAPYFEYKTPHNPLNAYGRSKKALEDFANNFSNEKNAGECKDHVSIVGLRYCNVYGPGEQHKGRRSSMIYQLIKQMKLGDKPTVFKHGWHRRDWIYVEDVVAANLKAMDVELNFCDTFNCGSGDSITFNRIIEIINDELGVWLEPFYAECSFADKYQHHTKCDMHKAENILGFKPQYSIEEGIRKFMHQI